MAKVKPIPDGYHTVTPYLIVKGAADAIEFYKKAFGATEMMRMPTPGGKIGHAEIQIGDSPSCSPTSIPEMGFASPQTLGGSPRRSCTSTSRTWTRGSTGRSPPARRSKRPVEGSVLRRPLRPARGSRSATAGTSRRTSRT